MLHALQNVALAVQVIVTAYIAYTIATDKKIQVWHILAYSVFMFVLVYWIATLSV